MKIPDKTNSHHLSGIWQANFGDELERFRNRGIPAEGAPGGSGVVRILLPLTHRGRILPETPETPETSSRTDTPRIPETPSALKTTTSTPNESESKHTGNVFAAGKIIERFGKPTTVID